MRRLLLLGFAQQMSGLSIKSLVRSGSAALGVDARQLEQALERSAHAAGFLGQSSGVAVLLVFLHEGELTTSGGGDCAFPAGARCLYFIRDTEDFNYGTLQASSKTSLLDTLSRLITEIYQPCIRDNMFGFTKKMMEGDKARLVDSQNRALDVVHRAIESLHSVLELTGVDAADLVRPAPSPRAAPRPTGGTSTRTS